MSAQSFAVRLGRNWFSVLVLVSATLVVVTFLSFAFGGAGPLPRVLFWLGLAGENNVGAWWSGMLLLVAAVLALDGFAADRANSARRGWVALAAVLLILSFDEIASLHEYLATSGIEYLAILAVALFALTGYSFIQLLRSRVHARTLLLLLLAFALLGTVPLQEYVQHTREWPNPVIYGLRAAIEEGIELSGMLLLVRVASRNTKTLLRIPGGDPFEFARHRAAVIGAAAVLAPVLVAATFVLPYPGGPADWLAAACYLGSALLVVKRALPAPEIVPGPAVALFAWYLAGSVGSNAIQLAWDPAILGEPVGLRGLFVALLLATGLPILRAAGRAARPLLFGGGAFVALVGAMWPQSQLLWCAFPVLVALHVYSIESGMAAVDRPSAHAASGIVAAGPADG